MASQAVEALSLPECRCLAGVARREITPPAGMYARAWGSSVHDVADGVHQPLLASCVAFKSEDESPELFLIAMDIMVFFNEEAARVRAAILSDLGLQPQQLMLHPSHTHSMPMLLRKDADRPGGHLIGPYLDALPGLLIELISEARSAYQKATLTWNSGRCSLAFTRDYLDQSSGRDVCGLNPAVEADDTVLVGRITGMDGKCISTLVNYACHPVSLGGGNRLLSPDYIGPMRQVVEQNVGGICVFLQGAAGDLTPRRSYESDVEAAEQNGRELGYAALAALSGMYPAAHRLEYEGVEESGTALGLWSLKRKPAVDGTVAATRMTAELPLKSMPTRAELEAKIASGLDRVELERAERALARRDLLGDKETGSLPFTVWRLGESFLVSTPAEPYSEFQVALRAAHPDSAVAVLMATDGAMNYLPTRSAYDRDVYQVNVAYFATGALETVTELASSTIGELKN